jgi:hypothetical protein
MVVESFDDVYADALKNDEIIDVEKAQKIMSINGKKVKLDVNKYIEQFEINYVYESEVSSDIIKESIFNLLKIFEKKLEMIDYITFLDKMNKTFELLCKMINDKLSKPESTDELLYFFYDSKKKSNYWIAMLFCKHVMNINPTMKKTHMHFVSNDKKDTLQSNGTIDYYLLDNFYEHIAKNSGENTKINIMFVDDALYSGLQVSNHIHFINTLLKNNNIRQEIYYHFASPFFSKSAIGNVLRKLHFCGKDKLIMYSSDSVHHLDTELSQNMHIVKNIASELKWKIEAQNSSILHFDKLKQKILAKGNKQVIEKMVNAKDILEKLEKEKAENDEKVKFYLNKFNEYVQKFSPKCILKSIIDDNQLKKELYENDMMFVHEKTNNDNDEKEEHILTLVTHFFGILHKKSYTLQFFEHKLADYQSTFKHLLSSLTNKLVLMCINLPEYTCYLGNNVFPNNYLKNNCLKFKFIKMDKVITKQKYDNLVIFEKNSVNIVFDVNEYTMIELIYDNVKNIGLLNNCRLQNNNNEVVHFFDIDEQFGHNMCYHALYKSLKSQKGGNDTIYEKKYLKYKEKYTLLKKNMHC